MLMDQREITDLSYLLITACGRVIAVDVCEVTSTISTIPIATVEDNQSTTCHQ